jgi:hypothetical protein
MKSLKTVLLTLMVVVVYVLHQDFWNWRTAQPLVFGFLPIGLAYQAGYSILAAVTMGLLVKFAWPKHLEDTEPFQASLPGQIPRAPAAKGQRAHNAGEDAPAPVPGFTVENPLSENS